MNGEGSTYDVLLFFTILSVGINVLLTMGSAGIFILMLKKHIEKKHDAA
jgi:hypothetical protein